MKHKSWIKKHPFTSTVISMMAILIGSIAVSGIKNDFHIKTKKIFLSELTIETLENKWSSTTRWANWFFNLDSVIFPKGTYEPGDFIKLKVTSPKKYQKPFYLTLKVENYVPKRTLKLKLVEDSSQKITKLLSDIIWNIQIENDETGKNKIIAEISATTKTWKSRFYGSYAKDILLNQIFYPDLISFTEKQYLFDIPEQIFNPFKSGM
jgi:hypothetical protein